MKAYQEIRDVSYTFNADLGMVYSSPCRGTWNIVHYGLLVPEGHEIYVCPTSCLRGVVLTTAELGIQAMKKLSTITVGEDNLLDGDMEEELYHGTKEILSKLDPKPRMVMIFTSCVHHFLAVNYQRVYRKLRQEYPDIDFIDCYMDPVMRRKNPPDPSLRRQVLRVLKPAEKEADHAAFVGNCFPMEWCDLIPLLKQNGIRISDLTMTKTYDEFLDQAHASVNFTFHRAAAPAARDLKIRLGQEWVEMHETYDYEAIEKDLDRAAEAMHIPPYSQAEYAELRKQTEAKVEKAREVLDGIPVSIDYTLIDEPLGLALYLLDHGFEVESVLIDSIHEDESVFRKLQARKPDLRFYNSLNWNMRACDRTHDGKIIGIGQKAAYFNNTPYFINAVENAGMYGFQGIMRLMDLLIEAAEQPKDLKQLVQVKGWGCRCNG